MIKFSDGTQFEDMDIYGYPHNMRGANREAIKIHLKNTDYESIKAAFIDGAAFSVVQVLDDSEETFNKSDYCVAGDIQDHRDGTFTVFMGVLTDIEKLTEENANLLLTTIGG